MSFNKFKQQQQNHIGSMLEGEDYLFLVDVDKDELWETYLDSFPAGTNEIFRERREHDCSCCKGFIRTFGNVVTIKDNEITTIWDFDASDCYVPVARALSELVRSKVVSDAFITKQSGFGTDQNLEALANGDVHTWHHFRASLPARFLSRSSKSEAAVMGECRDTRNVFKRSLDEISPTALETVLDLITEKTLYRGEEWLPALHQFKELFDEYHTLPPSQQDNYTWIKSMSVGGAVGRIRNHSIGVLLQDLSDDMEMNRAMERYEGVMAPANYKRPKAVFSKRMVEEAQKTVAEMGLLDSLPRRHARIGDVTVNNVIWANRDATKHMDGVGGIFEMLVKEAATKTRDFEHVPGISVDSFISDILPTASSIEVYLENRHAPNLVSLVAPQNREVPSLFKWDNSFSWAYSGNISDASMKERVKAAGGKVDGVLRFSIQWNTAGDNYNDFDAHCEAPGEHIYFGQKAGHASLGNLDVDIIQPSGTAVENITWPRLDKMRSGEYRFYVNNYSHRGGTSGFEAEIEFDGQTYQYEYHRDIRQGGNVVVARIMFDGRVFKFLESLPSTTSSKSLWGMTTNNFQPVSMVTYSPNYWDGQRNIGNKHYFFIVPACKNDEEPSGFFNEYLNEDLMPHKRVFEALGNKMKVTPSEEQLSGLGFSSTIRNSLVVKVDGNVTKIIF